VRPVADTRRMGGSLLRLWARRRAEGAAPIATATEEVVRVAA
jgi:hypothetical protein